jgi:hypothetical protein
MHPRTPYHRMIPALVVAAVAAFAPAHADTPHPDHPVVPLQTRPGEDRGAWLLQGWARTESGTSGQGRTLLVVEGEADYRISIQLEDRKIEMLHPAEFELPDADQMVVVSVVEPRGATWEGSVEVPKGMKVILDIKARYEHRGYLGTLKNDTLSCPDRTVKARRLRFDVMQERQPVTPEIVLDAGKSAPGVRLKVGKYDVLVSEFLAGDWRETESVPLEIKDPDWRFEYGCIR